MIGFIDLLEYIIDKILKFKLPTQFGVPARMFVLQLGNLEIKLCEWFSTINVIEVT